MVFGNLGTVSKNRLGNPAKKKFIGTNLNELGRVYQVRAPLRAKANVAELNQPSQCRVPTPAIREEAHFPREGRIKQIFEFFPLAVGFLNRLWDQLLLH